MLGIVKEGIKDVLSYSHHVLNKLFEWTIQWLIKTRDKFTCRHLLVQQKWSDANSEKSYLSISVLWLFRKPWTFTVNSITHEQTDLWIWSIPCTVYKYGWWGVNVTWLNPISALGTLPEPIKFSENSLGVLKLTLILCDTFMGCGTHVIIFKMIFLISFGIIWQH